MEDEQGGFKLLNDLLAIIGTHAYPPLDNPTFYYKEVKLAFGTKSISEAMDSLSCDGIIQKPKNGFIDWKTLEKLLTFAGKHDYSTIAKHFIDYANQVYFLRTEIEKLKSENTRIKNANVCVDKINECVHTLDLRVQLEKQKNLSVILDMLSKQIITVEDAQMFIL